MNVSFIDTHLVAQARQLASEITAEVQRFIDLRTSVSIERAALRLLGIEGADSQGIPLVNKIVNNLMQTGEIAYGAAYWLAGAVLATGDTPQTLAVSAASSETSRTNFPQQNRKKIEEKAQALARSGWTRIRHCREERAALTARYGERPTPWLYVIVATGNIHEDSLQAQMAARQGADVIAVIRSTAQSLLDYVPEGATTEGFGGTYATQENFRIMRRALDAVSEELGRYVRLTNYASGLCMPEIAALGALERLDMMLSDSMYGIIFRDINMQRTFVDQHFARWVQAQSGIIINTGEDNYLTTSDAFDAADTVLASQFINEQFALRSGMHLDQIGLGHAFEMDPVLEDGLLYEMADALLSRFCFPASPLKYMPPTRHIDGNIFQAQTMNALFNLTSIGTGQHIHLVGMMTEAIHTPLLQDRFLALQNARYVFNYARHFGEEMSIRPDGRIARRISDVLARAVRLLENIRVNGLFSAIERGAFAATRRSRVGGRGSDGIIIKHENYLNPFEYRG